MEEIKSGFYSKTTKMDYGDVGYFRPISLTQFVFKTMEHIVEWSLREHAFNYGTILDCLCTIQGVSWYGTIGTRCW